MRRFSVWCGVLFLIVGSANAAESQGKLIRENWHAAYLNGKKAGHVHTTVREVEREGQKLLHSLMELNLTAQRFGDKIQISAATGTDETPEGKVVGVYMRQALGKEQTLVQTGVVEGKQIHIRVKGSVQLDKRNPWNDQVVGLEGQERIFHDHKVKPGDTFSYYSYEPQITLVIKTRVTVKDYEDLVLPGTSKKQRLLRVEGVGDKILGFQPPTVITWLDKDLMPVRSQFDDPGMGQLLLVRTTKEIALGEDTAPEIGKPQLIQLNRPIPRPYDSQNVTYRITIKDDDDPTTAFARDNRQEITKVRNNTVEVRVKTVHGPQTVEDESPVDDEYLKSCFFINSDDAKVKELAARAVGKENDPWQKARRIESWVHNNMEETNYTEALATADHVARTLEGDCTEYAMLTAAMCRAVGVPSRTAVGLIYVDTPKGPAMAFHMWTEVYVQGQWVSIDATLGRGFVGGSHLKIADHSWYDTQTATPLLSVLRVLGKISIEVVKVGNGN